MPTWVACSGFSFCNFLLKLRSRSFRVGEDKEESTFPFDRGIIAHEAHGGRIPHLKVPSRGFLLLMRPSCPHANWVGNISRLVRFNVDDNLELDFPPSKHPKIVHELIVYNKFALNYHSSRETPNKQIVNHLQNQFGFSSMTGWNLNDLFIHWPPRLADSSSHSMCRDRKHFMDNF